MIVHPRLFAQVAFVVLVTNVAIVLTGAVVRLTGSGLGCPTWPTCDGANLIGAWEWHPAIEWGNRLFTTLVALSAVVAAIAARRLRPYRKDIFLLSLGLLAGVAAQIVLGGITVLVKLNPLSIMGHFAVSMVILVDALVLCLRAREHAGGPAVRVGRGDPASAVARRWLAAGLVATGAAILLGTATTAAGPHSGGENITRLGNLQMAARIHGAAVVVLIGIALWGRVSLQRVAGTEPVLRRLSTAVLYLLFGQGVLGFIQYQLKLPRGLVELHVGLACAIWLVSVALAVRSAAPAASLDSPAAGSQATLERAGDPGVDPTSVEVARLRGDDLAVDGSCVDA